MSTNTIEKIYIYIGNINFHSHFYGANIIM